MTMKRLLIITYYWPPTGGSGVQRWVKFSKYLPQYGWQPVIYTPENPERLSCDESLLSDIPECAEVIKTRIAEPYGVYRALAGSRGGAREVNPLNAQKKSLGKKISLWLRGNLFVPDPRVWWVRPSLRCLVKYLREHPVDAVVTTGPPQSMHLIGRGLKRKLGLRWIADFRDPWTEMFYYKHLSLTGCSDRKHRRLEQSVLDEADLVIAVSPPVARDFASKTATRVELVTNGYDEDDFSAALPERTDGRFTLVHTGLFASDGNPLKLWDALAGKCREDAVFRSRLQIRLAGKTDPEIISAIRERGLGDNLVDLGYLPHTQTVAEQRSADVLLLPLRREPEYSKVLPGKIFEYIAARRPVLGIGQTDGAAAAVLRDSGAGEMFGWDETARPLGFLLTSHPEPHGADKYSRRRLTERLVELL